MIRDMAQENEITLMSGGLPYMASTLISTADHNERQEYLAPVEYMRKKGLILRKDYYYPEQ